VKYCLLTPTQNQLKLAMLEDYFEEEEEEEQQQKASAEVAITNNGQQNQPTALLCSFHSQRKGTVYKCATCDTDLCVVPCFAENHTKVRLWPPLHSTWNTTRPQQKTIVTPRPPPDTDDARPSPLGQHNQLIMDIICRHS